MALEALRKAPTVSIGVLADAFVASVASGNPCNVAVLERAAAVDSGAKTARAERDIRVWEETRQECNAAVKAKRTDVVAAKDRVAHAAREVITAPEIVDRLMDGVAAMQAALVARRAAHRFIISRQAGYGRSGHDPRSVPRCVMPHSMETI